MLQLTQPDGSKAFALLVGLGSRSALLRNGDARYHIPLDQLAGSWSGDFTTLWRAPPQFRSGIASNDPAIASWLRERFAAIDGDAPLTDAAMISKRLAQFQLSQGLQPDGLAGPVTLMALNRASRVPEPDLQVEP
jgi:general secretion pathway protein A